MSALKLSTEQMRFTASILMDAAGVGDDPRGWRILPDAGLIGPEGAVLSKAELRRIFDCVTLRGEVDKGHRDRCGRLDESLVDGEARSPWVDGLARDFAALQCPGVEAVEGTLVARTFKVLFSHDVDRTIGLEPAGLVRSVLREVGWRPEGALPLREAASIRGLVRNAERLFAYEKEQGIRSHVFMLAGPFGLGRYSSRTSAGWTSWNEIKKSAVSCGMKIGLHASYNARELDSYDQEKRRIEDFVGTPITCQRNHYLRYDPVRHWAQLERAGIDYDFSLGFVNRIGFRTGTSQAHRTFDLESGRESKVRAVPMVFMDTCLTGADERSILRQLRDALTAVRSSRGCVCLNFHPETFLIKRSSWGFFQKTVDLCLELGADIGGELPRTQVPGGSGKSCGRLEGIAI